jgi:hypothetical protein
MSSQQLTMRKILAAPLHTFLANYQAAELHEHEREVSATMRPIDTKRKRTHYFNTNSVDTDLYIASAEGQPRYSTIVQDSQQEQVVLGIAIYLQNLQHSYAKCEKPQSDVVISGLSAEEIVMTQYHLDILHADHCEFLARGGTTYKRDKLTLIPSSKQSCPVCQSS